jgi:hypothetical protein
MLQAANVLVLGQYALYNSTTNDVSDRPVVADPKCTEINQAYLQYKQGSFAGIGGRQVINLDNQRFVGNVAWRQNDQTYDAVTLKLGALTLFDYLLKFDDDDNYPPAASENLSSNSYGLYYAGNHMLSERTKLNWTGSYAHQSDTGDSTLDYDADYYLVEAGIGFDNYGLRAGYEVFGGNDDPGTTGFQTPLATLLAFQGWAEKFTTTPQAGVEDFYSGASASYKFGEKMRYEALLKFASYQADEFATDTTKTWLQFTATF